MSYFNQKSARLNFRKLTTEDIPSWLEFFHENDSLSYLGMDLSKKKEVLAEEWIRAQLKRYSTQGLGHLAVELRESGEFIGMGGILPRDVDGKAEFEIAYSLKPKYWNKGYATEIAQTMKTYAVSNIDAERFISIIDKRNVNSAKVAKKNDMALLFETHYLEMNVDVFGFINNHTE